MMRTNYHGGTECPENEFGISRTKRLIDRKIIGCAIEVHGTLGPGLSEITYESALAVESRLAGLNFQRQLVVPISYKSQPVGEYRLDLVVEKAAIVEIKSVDRVDPIFDAQLLAYLRITGIKRGLLLNFNSRLLKDGIKRLVI
jgi:GxxExxY protein